MLRSVASLSAGPRFLAHFLLQGPFVAIFSSNVAADRHHPGVGAQTHGHRVALHIGIFLLGLGSFRDTWAHLGLFWPLCGPFWPPEAHFGHF